VCAAARHGRDLVARVEDLLEAAAHRLEARVRFEHRARGGVALAHPGQRALALHLLEPEPGVVVGRGGLGQGGK
jgi:hypothetical protein